MLWNFGASSHSIAMQTVGVRTVPGIFFVLCHDGTSWPSAGKCVECVAPRSEWIPALHERITIRMTSEMIARIDAWIADQPGYVSRQEAVRRCVDLMLGQGDSEQGLVGASEPRARAAVHNDVAD